METTIKLELATTTIKGKAMQTAKAAASAILQTQVVRSEVEVQVVGEQSRLVKEYGKAAGLVQGKNKAGKGSPWNAVHEELAGLLKDAHHTLRSDNAVRLVINRALNAAGFKARERTVKPDTEKKVCVSVMEHCASRDKDGKIVDIDFDACIEYAGGPETPIAKAITKRFDKLAETVFKLGVESK